MSFDTLPMVHHETDRPIPERDRRDAGRSGHASAASWWTADRMGAARVRGVEEKPPRVCLANKRLSDLSVADIKAMTGVARSLHLEFKSAPVGGSNEDRREFLADASAFVNACGGDIVFGVEAQDGVACADPGVRLDDIETEKGRLGDLLRAGLDPPLTHFEMRWLPAQGGVGYLIVRLPKSSAAPHRVTFLGDDKFYVRNSIGKHPMSTDELRRAFASAEPPAASVNAFRSERISLLVNDEGPFPLQAGGPKLVVHIVPRVALAEPPSLGVGPQDTTYLRPFGSHGWDDRYTLEGFATHAGARDGSAAFVRAYTLAFRIGIIEAVASLGPEGGPISLAEIERFVLESWPPYMTCLQKHRVEPPLYVLMTLLGARGVTASVPPESALAPAPFRRHQLLLAPFEVSAETVQQAPPMLFRPLFDIVANAFGLPRSLSYRPDGTYAPRS